MALMDNFSYYDSVRRKLGFENISNEEIDDPLVKDFSVLKVISGYSAADTETDPLRVMYLRNAVVCFMSSQLCPLAAGRYEIEVKTIDTSWKHDKINWAQRKLELENEAELMVSKVVEASGEGSGQVVLMDIALMERDYR